MIEIKNLTLRRGNRVLLRDACLKLPSGAVYGVYGTGGDALLELLAGALFPTEGAVRVNGFDTAKDATRAKKSVGYLPCADALCPSLTVTEQLRFAAEARGVSYERALRQAAEVTRAVGIDDIADRVIGRLSRVERICVGIAQALVGGTDTVLLDAPTVGLSSADAEMIRGLVEELAESRTVILATDRVREVYELCDHAILLADGRVVEYDTVEALLDRAGVGEQDSEDEAVKRLTELLTSLCGKESTDVPAKTAARPRRTAVERDGEYELIDDGEVR